MNQLTKAAKTLAAKYNSTSLILRIAIGLVVGSVLALICPGAAWIEEFGNLFVGALKGVAPVLVFVIVASALAQGSSKLDRRFGTVVWLYMLTTFVAAALSVVTSKLFPQTLVLAEAATADVVPQGLGDVMHTLLSNIVSNPVASIMNGNYIGILMWACLFGLAMKKLGSDTTKNFMANTADAISTIVRWIINLAPFGIMGLVFTNVSDNGLSIFTQYGRLLLLLVGTMLLMALVINPFIIFIYLHRNPYPLVFRCLRESGLTAFFTRSSAANIPVNMSLCEKLGLDKDIYSVSILPPTRWACRSPCLPPSCCPSCRLWAHAALPVLRAVRCCSSPWPARCLAFPMILPCRSSALASSLALFRTPLRLR